MTEEEMDAICTRCEFGECRNCSVMGRYWRTQLGYDEREYDAEDED